MSYRSDPYFGGPPPVGPPLNPGFNAASPRAGSSANYAASPRAQRRGPTPASHGTYSGGGYGGGGGGAPGSQHGPMGRAGNGAGGLHQPPLFANAIAGLPPMAARPTPQRHPGQPPPNPSPGPPPERDPYDPISAEEEAAFHGYPSRQPPPPPQQHLNLAPQQPFYHPHPGFGANPSQGAQFLNAATQPAVGHGPFGPPANQAHGGPPFAPHSSAASSAYLAPTQHSSANPLPPLQPPMHYQPPPHPGQPQPYPGQPSVAPAPNAAAAAAAAAAHAGQPQPHAGQSVPPAMSPYTGQPGAAVNRAAPPGAQLTAPLNALSGAAISASGGGGGAVAFDLLRGSAPAVAASGSGRGEWDGLLARESINPASAVGSGSGSGSREPGLTNVWCQEFAGRLLALRAMHRRLHSRLLNAVSAPLQQFLLTKRSQSASLAAFQESLRYVWERWTAKEVRDFARVLSDHVPEIVWLMELTLSAELALVFCADFFNQDLTDHYIHFELRPAGASTASAPANYGWRWPPLTPVIVDPYQTLQRLAAQLCRAVHHWSLSSNYCDSPWNLEQLSVIVRETFDKVMDECLPLPVPKERELIDAAQKRAKEQQDTHADLWRILRHREPWLSTLDNIWRTRGQKNAQLHERALQLEKERQAKGEAERELRSSERVWQQRVATEALNSLKEVVQLGDHGRQLLSTAQQTLEQQAHLGKQISSLTATLVSFGTHLFSTVNSIRPAINSIATSAATAANASLAAAARPAPAAGAAIWPVINWSAANAAQNQANSNNANNAANAATGSAGGVSASGASAGSIAHTATAALGAANAGPGAAVQAAAVTLTAKPTQTPTTAAAPSAATAAPAPAPGLVGSVPALSGAPPPPAIAAAAAEAAAPAPATAAALPQPVLYPAPTAAQAPVATTSLYPSLAGLVQAPQPVYVAAAPLQPLPVMQPGQPLPSLTQPGVAPYPSMPPSLPPTATVGGVGQMGGGTWTPELYAAYGGAAPSAYAPGQGQYPPVHGGIGVLGGQLGPAGMPSPWQAPAQSQGPPGGGAGAHNSYGHYGPGPATTQGYGGPPPSVGPPMQGYGGAGSMRGQGVGYGGGSSMGGGNQFGGQYTSQTHPDGPMQHPHQFQPGHHQASSGGYGMSVGTQSGYGTSSGYVGSGGNIANGGIGGGSGGGGGHGGLAPINAGVGGGERKNPVEFTKAAAANYISRIRSAPPPLNYVDRLEQAHQPPALQR
jgi:hypothetical protein